MTFPGADGLPRKLPPLAEPPGLQDRLAWQPTWECYCCEDTGYITRAERVLSTTSMSDRPILCKRVGCAAAQSVQPDADIADTRLNATDCDMLHDLARQDWAETLAYWNQLRLGGTEPEIQNLEQIAQTVGAVNRVDLLNDLSDPGEPDFLN